MKGISSVSKEHPLTFGIGWVLKILLVATLLLFIVVVKYKYINMGYEISRLSAEMEEKELTYQKLLEEKISITQSDQLYEAAKKMKLTFPDHKKVFYVE